MGVAHCASKRLGLRSQLLTGPPSLVSMTARNAAVGRLGLSVLYQAQAGFKGREQQQEPLCGALQQKAQQLQKPPTVSTPTLKQQLRQRQDSVLQERQLQQQPPSKESFDQYLAIVSASSWQQLFDIFYDHHNVPSYQQCYGTLLQLLEVLPEMQAQQAAEAPSATAAGQDSLSNGSTADSNSADLNVSRGSHITNNEITANDREGIWRALAAAGKVQTVREVTALKALIRDVLRALQVQLHLFTPQELLDVLEAAVQLSQPSNLWLQAWEAALQPQLKQLQLQQLMQAAKGLMLCGHTPNKPWAGVWFVALQPHISACTRQQLAVVSLALKAWGCRPPLSWTEPYMEALQANMSQNNMPIADLLLVLSACVSLGLKPCGDWLKTYESASQGLLSDCAPSQLAVMIQGLQLLGHKASVEWLQGYLHAVAVGLTAWDVGSLGSVLMVLGQQPAGFEALEHHGSSSSSSSGSLLDAIVGHTQPLIEQVADPGGLISLLSGYHALKFTPPDDYLDLLLDETAARITARSAALLHQQPTDISDIMSAERAAGPASPSSSSNSSGHGTDDERILPGSNQEDEQLWLQAGSYKADRNINLGTARKQLESSWIINGAADGIQQASSRFSSWKHRDMDSQNQPTLSSNNTTSGPVVAGPAATAAAAGAAYVIGPMQASAQIVSQVLQLLLVVADMGLPVERSWAAEVLGALKGHCTEVDLPELQLLLDLCQRLGVVLEPNLVDEVLTKSHVDYTQLQPQDQLLLLSLLASSQTRPNNIWWQDFLATLQHSLPAHTPAQLVMLLVSLSDIGGRPPQAWLAAHESALLTNNTHSKQALSPEGWLLLLECYAQLMYQPSGELESVFERYMAGVLGSHTSLSPGGLASLVGSAGRLQLACSSQFEDGIISSIDEVLPGVTASELQQLVQGLLLLDVQLPSSTLHQLCEVAEPHLTSFRPSATCCLLHLLAAAGDYPPSLKWLSQALAGLEPQLGSLEVMEASMLLQSLKAFAAQPPEQFMTALQQHLLHVVPKMDAMGVAAMLQGLAACGCMPSPELQLLLAGHIKRGLARASQGMGPTPLWLALEVLVQVPAHAASPALLDEVLRQAAQQLSLEGSVTSSKMLQELLPHLAAAITPGGSWGLSYSPPPRFCDALCSATVEVPSLLSPTLWLDLLLRFSSGDMVGFLPAGGWVTVAAGQVLGGWGTGQGSDAWAAAPADQLAALIGGLGWLTKHDPQLISAIKQLPGWPYEALVRLSQGLGELQSHQMVTALIGVSQLYTAAEQAAAAAGASTAHDHGSNRGSSVSSSSSGHNSSSNIEEWYSRTRKGIRMAASELLVAAEAASLPKLSSMPGDDLAWLVHAMQQLNYVPSPSWVQTWASAALAQLPGASGQSAVMCVAAIAAYEVRPAPLLLQQLLDHCQQHMGELQLPELLALGRSLQLLGYKPNEGFLGSLARAGTARIEALVQSPGFRVAVPGASNVAGPDVRKAALMELQKVLLGLQLQDDP